jgi:hypothetical protein
MSETGQRVIMVALPVEAQIRQLDERQAAAVNRAIDRLGTVQGRRIDLPTADPAYPYYALQAGSSGAPVIIYRQMRLGEGGDWLVVSLMTPAEYRQQIEDEQSGLLRDPAIRQEIRVAAGTAATTAVKAIPAPVNGTSAGGATPTYRVERPRASG